MNRFTRNIAPHVKAEMEQASLCFNAGRPDDAFRHLENAHVLGQASTYWHVVVHVKMFRWGMRQRDYKEVRGQLMRIIGACFFTWFMAVPKGNTGGSNVSAIEAMPIKPEFEKIIQEAKSK